jgi:hypothetical protein
VKGKEKVDGSNNIKTNLVNSRMVNARTRRIEPMVKEKGKTKLLNATNVVVQTTLLRNAKFPNTWLNCTKDP